MIVKVEYVDGHTGSFGPIVSSAQADKVIVALSKNPSVRTATCVSS